MGISNYAESITKGSYAGSVSDPIGSASTAGSPMGQAFYPNEAGFLGFPLAADSAIGGTIGEISNQANVSPDLTQSSAGLKPALGEYPIIGIRNLFRTATSTASTRTFITLATPYTFSFKGTGTFTLSGTSSAGPLVGTSASNRVSLTFTPTAGTLTLTLSGSATDMMIEAGSTLTAYQDVISPSRITESSIRSVICPHYDTTDYMTFGVGSMGNANFNCESGKPFSLLFFWLQTQNDTLGTIAGKCGSSNADKTLQVRTTSTTIRMFVRGTQNNITTPVIDGRPHCGIFVWDGTTATTRLSDGSLTTISVGTAVDEAAQNLLVGANNSAVPENTIHAFLLPPMVEARALSATEQVNILAFCRTNFGCV